jgi:uncharacterized membrane protein YhhN
VVVVMPVMPVAVVVAVVVAMVMAVVTPASHDEAHLGRSQFAESRLGGRRVVVADQLSARLWLPQHAARPPFRLAAGRGVVPFGTQVDPHR